MAETRITYHKEVKTASFQGKPITLENLTPILSPKAQDKRKREIESCLFEVFIKYAPGRAQMVWYKASLWNRAIGGEEFNYEGRFDIGDGEGDLIAHIRNFYEYSLSPDCPFVPEWKRQGEDYYREQMETLRFGQDVFIPFLEQHTELTSEDEKLLAKILATESDWNRKSEDKEQSEEIENTEEQPAAHEMPAEVEKAAKEQETEPPQERFEVTMTSDAFPDPEDA